MDKATTTAADRVADASVPDSAGSAFPVHSDRQLWLPVQLSHGRAGGPGRHGRLAVRTPVRLAERVRRPGRPRRGRLQVRPFGSNVPSDRIYEPGTNTLVTSWKTPTGWVVVRDALAMGPRRGEDTVTPHTRPPSDEDADHALVRTATCIDGTVEIDLVCEPAFDYGRVPGEWTLSSDRHRADATGADQALRLQTDMLVGIEAGRAGPATSCAPARRPTAHWAGATKRLSRPPPTRPSISSRRRRGSGVTGLRVRRFPTTSSGR